MRATNLMGRHLATKLRGRIKPPESQRRTKPPQTPRSASNPYRDKMPEPAGPEEPDQPNPAEIPACSVFPQGFGELAQARTTCSTNGSAPPTVSILMSPLLHTTGFRPGDDWLSSHWGISDYSTCLPCILVEPYMAFLVARDTQEMDQRETR